MNPSHPPSPKDELQSEGREQPPQPGLAVGQGRGGAGSWHAERSHTLPAKSLAGGQTGKKKSQQTGTRWLVLFCFALLFDLSRMFSKQSGAHLSA